MPSIASEASAVRHGAQAAQGPRSIQSPDDADQTSPFSALLNETNGPPAAPQAATPTAPAAAASLKPAPRVQEGTAARIQDGAAVRPRDNGAFARPPSAETASSTQRAPTDNSTSPVPPSDGQKAADNGAAAVAALANGAGEERGHPDAVLATAPSEASVVNISVDPNATSGAAPAPTDRHDDKGTKSDASDSNSNAAATPAPVTGQQVQQPVAAAVTLGASAAAPPTGDTDENGSGNEHAVGAGGRAPDPGQIAALGDAIKAGRGTADRSGAPPSAPDSTAGPATEESGAKPAAKTSDATRPTPAPIPSEKTLPTGQDQATAASGSQPRATAANSAGQAAASKARELAARDGADDGDAAAPADSNPSAAADPDATSSREAPVKLIADINRAALDTLVRHVERPEIVADSSAGGGQVGGPAQTLDAAPVALAAQTTSPTQTNAPTATASQPAVPIAGIAVEIAAQAQAGRSRFDIRLDPPELGRIDVRLDVDRDGKVTSRLIVDRPETLDILRRDASEIERSLQQAGVKTADNNALQFSLRDNGTSGGFGNFGGYNPYSNNGAPVAARLIIPDRDLPPIDAAAGQLGGTGGIDIRV